MYHIYVYVLDTMADWELGYAISELNSGRYFKKSAPQLSLKTVSFSNAPVKTMGGLTITPDCLIEDIAMDSSSVLILPGANTWNSPEHGRILETARGLLSLDALVCAICGATAALANLGLLDACSHTSNGPGFLEMFCPAYKGSSFYIDQPAVADSNLITASSTGALLWAKLILEHLEVFERDTLNAWYEYFHTGTPASFYALMQTLTPDIV